MIQIDEPALREGLPLRRADWAALSATGRSTAFRLRRRGVRDDDPDPHPHVLLRVQRHHRRDRRDGRRRDLDRDLALATWSCWRPSASFRYPNEIGPGVYDIHSPRVPTPERWWRCWRRPRGVIPREQLWVNPDCGLKTRGWPETRAALANMVAAAHRRRALVRA